MSEVHLTLLFLRRPGELLLAMKKRGHGAGKWNGVGGKIELSETIQQAAIRECEEEIGIRPHKLQPIAEHIFYEHEDGIATQRVVYVYFCDTWEGEPIETEEMTPQWFKEGDIPYEAMWPADQYWLPKALAGAKAYGTYRFDEHGTMFEHTVSSVDTLPHESDMLR